MPGYNEMSLVAVHSINDDYVEIRLLDRPVNNHWASSQTVICKYGPISDPNSSFRSYSELDREVVAEDFCYRVLLHIPHREGPKAKDLLQDKFWQVFIDDVKLLATVSHVSHT